jgi:putative ABC transport system substrate-binding protein
VEVTPKRLELLHEAVSVAGVFAALINPTSPTAESQSKKLQALARDRGVQLQILQASSDRDFDTVFATLAQLQVPGLVIASDTMLGTHGEQLAAQAVRAAVPAIHQSRDFALAGGLMSYGGSFFESHRQAGISTGRILKGEKPASLPVQQVTKVEFFINLKTAKTLGLTLPPTLLARADEIIE